LIVVDSVIVQIQPVLEGHIIIVIILRLKRHHSLPAMALLCYVPRYSHINLVKYSDYFYIIYRALQTLASNVCTFPVEMLHSPHRHSRIRCYGYESNRYFLEDISKYFSQYVLQQNRRLQLNFMITKYE